MGLQGLVAGQHVDLLIGVHGVPQAQARTQLQVARGKNAFEQQDRAAPAQVAHALRLIEVEQRKSVGCAQGRVDARNAVPVGIGLDNGPYLCIACCTPAALQVVVQGCGINDGFDRAWHGKRHRLKMVFSRIGPCLDLSCGYCVVACRK